MRQIDYHHYGVGFGPKMSIRAYPPHVSVAVAPAHGELHCAVATIAFGPGGTPPGPGVHSSASPHKQASPSSVPKYLKLPRSHNAAQYSFVIEPLVT